jgi:hypothetical protein
MERAAKVWGTRVPHTSFLFGCKRGAKSVSVVDRARPGVTKGIGHSIKAIRSVHEGLAHHLERHVETGRLCMYLPDPATPVTFGF